MNSNKTCLVIAGPTAVGKTSFAIDLAQRYSTGIISADSRQCFRELDIGVAKPSPGQLQAVKHWFINSHSVKEEVNARVFEAYALEKIQEIFRHHDVAIVVGGTGLYIKAFCDGLDELPGVDPAVREKIRKAYEEKGIGWLKNSIENTDPLFLSRGEIMNPQRMMRALEVKLSTGKSILEFHSGSKTSRGFTIKKIGLQMPRAQLHQNIDQRVDDMMQSGLLDEVRSLLPMRELNALQTVGYRELFDHLDGNISLAEAVERIKIDTRQYAKRQMTWFRKDKEIEWINPSEMDKISLP